ncbi:hypothetical protein J6590_015483 [Homalodisca vitripennis]|nr:hypothetical protein J6590_015483 [Homalodisca vitripennis]
MHLKGTVMRARGWGVGRWVKVNPHWWVVGDAGESGSTGVPLIRSTCAPELESTIRPENTRFDFETTLTENIHHVFPDY